MAKVKEASAAVRAAIDKACDGLDSAYSIATEALGEATADGGGIIITVDKKTVRRAIKAAEKAIAQLEKAL